MTCWRLQSMFTLLKKGLQLLAENYISDKSKAFSEWQNGVITLCRQRLLFQTHLCFPVMTWWNSSIFRRCHSVCPHLKVKINWLASSLILTSPSLKYTFTVLGHRWSFDTGKDFFFFCSFIRNPGLSWHIYWEETGSFLLSLLSFQRTLQLFSTSVFSGQTASALLLAPSSTLLSHIDREETQSISAHFSTYVQILLNNFQESLDFF